MFSSAALSMIVTCFYRSSLPFLWKWCQWLKYWKLFISNTFSFIFKPFHPLTCFLLCHTIVTRLNWYSLVNLRYFLIFCLHKVHISQSIFFGAHRQCIHFMWPANITSGVWLEYKVFMHEQWCHESYRK